MTENLIDSLIETTFTEEEKKQLRICKEIRERQEREYIRKMNEIRLKLKNLHRQYSS